MVDDRVVDIVQPDICYIGGIHRTLKVARMAEQAGIPVTPHCANLSMVTAIYHAPVARHPKCRQVFGIFPLRAKTIIHGNRIYSWNRRFTITEGKATVTDTPGWGVESSSGVG